MFFNNKNTFTNLVTKKLGAKSNALESNFAQYNKMIIKFEKNKEILFFNTKQHLNF